MAGLGELLDGGHVEVLGGWGTQGDLEVLRPPSLSPAPCISSVWPLLTYILYVIVSCSVMSDSVTPWIIAHQAPLFMEFSKQEYWGM